MTKHLTTPLTPEDIEGLAVGDRILLSGRIFCGRDAVLPDIVTWFHEGTLADHGIDLEGSVIFHTAVSDAGVGPTSSNKEAIEQSIPDLSEAGVKLHLGKGALQAETVAALDRFGSVYGITPPVTALLTHNIKSRRVVACPELGMEAFHELEVTDYPVIIGAAHGHSIYEKEADHDA